MNEVWWEGRVLFLLVYWLLVKVISDSDRLQNRMDHALLRDIFVWLYTRQTKWCYPLNWVTCGCNYFGALGKPLLDVIGILE